MQPMMILILTFIISTSLILLIFSIIGNSKDPVLKRLREIGKAPEEEEHLPVEYMLDKKEKNISKFLNSLGKLLGNGHSVILRKTLMQAGFYRENSVSIFYGIKASLGLTAFFMMFFVGILSNRQPVNTLMYSLLSGFAGYMLPNLILSHIVRKRQEQIAAGLPDALDFLVICVEAGLGLNSAIVRVGKEIGMKNRAISEEFLLVNHEMKTGISREKAFQNLSYRNRVRYLSSLSSAIILSDRLGTNIADTLRAQSDSLRTFVRQKAEEQAAKAGIKMLLPLVFLILPALFIIILGPAFISMMDSMGAVISK